MTLHIRLFAYLKLILLLAVLTITSSCRDESAHSGAESRQTLSGLETLQLQSQELPSYRELAGTVISDSSVPLATKLMSRIEVLSVDVGDSVQAGQLLVSLDDSDIVAMRSEASAMRAEARATLGEVDAAHQLALAGVSGAESGVSKAETALADAQRDLERAATLFAEGVIPRSALDKAELARDTAADNVLQAQAALEQARAGVDQVSSRTPQVESRELQAAARDSQAAALQQYAVLRAPFDGIVTARYFEPGQLSVPGAVILTIERLEGQRVRVNIPQELAASLQPGSEVEVLSGSPDSALPLSATLALISAAADPASQTFSAEVLLPPGSNVPSGQFVRIRVPGVLRSSISVPAGAVVYEGELSFVWRISSANVLSRVVVETAETSTGATEIVRGLAAGDRIVVNPSAELFEGALVESAAAAEQL